MHLVTFELNGANGSEQAERSASRREARTTRFSDGALGFDEIELLRPGARRLGALMPPGRHAGGFVDLNRALTLRLATEDVGAPEAEADSLLPCDLSALLLGGGRSLAIARDTFAWALDSLRRFDRPDLERGGVVLARQRVHVLSPVPRPGKLVGVACSDATAGSALGAHQPGGPALFIKASSSVIGTDDDIVLPAVSPDVDCAGALAIVIGRRCRDVPPDIALECVAGYTIANDVAALDVHGSSGQGGLGSSCDTFGPLGPCLVTRDEVGDPQKLRLETRVNGELLQSATTAEMRFPVAELIALASRGMTLEPGDVILTGAPPGDGSAGNGRHRIADGDFVEIEVEGIGQLRNHVRAERRPGREGR